MTQPNLHQAAGSPFTRIIAVGAARGDLNVPNDDIVGPIESSDEWIRQRTGVISRTRASASVSAADLATSAANEGCGRGQALSGGAAAITASATAGKRNAHAPPA
jgi:3-oxoacyl-[acyl-carrier-protein] synthase-3